MGGYNLPDDVFPEIQMLLGTKKKVNTMRFNCPNWLSFVAVPQKFLNMMTRSSLCKKNKRS